MSDTTDPTAVQADDNTEVQIEDLDGGTAAAYSVASSMTKGCFAA
ncbi:hypothetical protein [Streptomyces sp. NBC_00454]